MRTTQAARVMVLSANEDRNLAETVASILSSLSATAGAWTTAFDSGDFSIESLEKMAERNDYFILIAKPLDEAKVRGELYSVPRDNIVFEYGFFTARKGRHRCFLMTPVGVALKLPSDVGMNRVSFDPDDATSLARACHGIYELMVDRDPYPAPLIYELKAHAFMKTEDVVFRRAADLVKRAKTSVNATCFRPTPWNQGTTAKLEYLRALAQRAADRGRDGEFRHRILYPSPTKEVRANFEERRKAFILAGSESALDAKTIDRDWAIDLLLVDSAHMHISFQRSDGGALIHGFELRQAIELVGLFNEWFINIFGDREATRLEGSDDEK